MRGGSVDPAYMTSRISKSTVRASSFSQPPSSSHVTIVVAHPSTEILGSTVRLVDPGSEAQANLAGHAEDLVA